jgi:hypothetical protein
VLLARLFAPLRHAAMFRVQPRISREDAEQSTYEHGAQRRARVPLVASPARRS